MKKLRISHIVSCAGQVKFPQNYSILKAHNLEDEPEQDILTFIEESFQFIEKARSENGIVFVHCLAGKSRSPTIIIAYLMRMQQVPLKQIYHLVYEARDLIQPNDGFMMQLLQLETKLLGSTSFEVNEWKNIKPRHNKKTRLTFVQHIKKQEKNEQSSSSDSNNDDNNNNNENNQNSEEEMKRLNEEIQAIALSTKFNHTAHLKNEIIDKINEYLEQILTVEVLLKAIGNVDNLYSTLSNSVFTHKRVGPLMGQIKKHVGKELFTQTSGGEYLRSKDDRIEWKDIANLMESRIILLLEKEVFQKKLLLRSNNNNKKKHIKIICKMENDYETESNISSESWYNLVGEEILSDLDNFYELDSDSFDCWESDMEDEKEILVGETISFEKELENESEYRRKPKIRKYSIDYVHQPSILSKSMIFSLHYNIEQISKEVASNCIFASKRTSKKVKKISYVVRDQCRKASRETVELMHKSRVQKNLLLVQ
ncbi:hypothetical protein PPL_07606 [Heterostelium album PN500]|uniref:protein-tyrosine-phosphatase n=1 Tax=Heterostelium pallidum (strain ATCC 26659 / Pp 5 / PN500) TaxID=670386 RepID=D3BGF5_HETP5|nr:hypothetical protein PPL_07606 [Heterostelium album PN500]EFA79555.1 hypothetical protein PPL_07606 [Heterostelium album PN500]|eukprot:XP_020431676.1 hypothetical protein PPL_07606 [Heterostelium album PN500]